MAQRMSAPSFLRELLRAKEEDEENESKRTHWYWNQRVKLWGALGGKKRIRKSADSRRFPLL